MGFVKVQKDRAYYKRYQVKYRRRREGRTDYYARRRLVTQDKNKYNSPKYRFVVRISNTRVLCQIIYSKIAGDFVTCQAQSTELKRYGIKVGFANYAAAYATGLLLARRHLTNLKLADKYVGKAEPDGNLFIVEEIADAPRPFYALLDVGLARTTTGAKVFAALKGACDGGIEIPHNEKRLVGYSAEEKKLDPAVLKKYIFGGHVADYMRSLEKNQEKYNRQFGLYIKQGVKPDDIEGVYKSAHAAIRKDPTFQKKEKTFKGPQKRWTRKAMTYSQRKERIKQKIESWNKRQQKAK